MQKWLIPLLLFFIVYSHAQVANYVNNGGFEQYWSCTYPNDILLPTGWRTTDSLTDPSRYYSTCAGIVNVPVEGGQLQLPRTGNAFVLIMNYCLNGACNSNFNRTYARNRLKAPLQAGVNYCVKFYVNVRNVSTTAVDAIGAAFTNNQTLDTILNKNRQLTFISPQISNGVGNIITDTMNWVLITGTFVANGTESNLIIGNFKTNTATNTLQINPGSIYETDLFLDDISCIPLDLPAYAAPNSDVWAIPGNTIYLGRAQDVGINEACMWYKLPNTTNAIDTAAGITITVAATTETYIVKQDICGVIKYDTVVVHPSAVGVSATGGSTGALAGVEVFPNPAQDFLELKANGNLKNESQTLLIFNALGQLMREEEIVFKDSKAKIETSDFENGLYFLTLKNNTEVISSKRFVIAR